MGGRDAPFWGPPPAPGGGGRATRGRVARTICWVCGSALLPRALSRGGLLGLLLLATPALAFEPMPPIMQTLLKVFPEENGRFVDEPFGSIESMPKEARPLFGTFRVVVPTPDDIEKDLARLFASSSEFPIKKITRYDKNPGAPGLPGFRGAWCQTEDDDQVGFSIVTINQNRFLIWAKMGYYPAFANDSINPKVRDQYARDVSQYLAGIDMRVPDNEVPQASGRGLPEWMGLYTSSHSWEYLDSLWQVLRSSQEIQTWGISGVTAFVPDEETLQRISRAAADSVVYDQDPEQLQGHLQRIIDGEVELYISATPFGSKGLVDLLHGGLMGDFDFAIDRFGRMRYCSQPAEGDRGMSVTCLFPATPILSVGSFAVSRADESGVMSHSRVQTSLSPSLSTYFHSWTRPMSRERIVLGAQMHLYSLGHFIKVMEAAGVRMGELLIRTWHVSRVSDLDR